MATNRATISAAIIAQLQTVAALHGHVLDYQPAELQAFPTAVVVGAGFTDQIVNTGGDLRLYEYDIIVYLERGKQAFGTAKSERIRRELEDDIMAILDGQQTLGGSVLWCRVRNGGWGYSPDNSLAYFLLNLTAYQYVSIT